LKQCINSISRPILNQRLLESLPSDITIRFNTKLSRLDLDSRTAWASSPEKSKPMPGQEDDDGEIGGETKRKDKGKRKVVEDEKGTRFDLVVGCDGSWSKVRSEMMRVERLVWGSLFLWDLKKLMSFAEWISRNHSYPTHISSFTCLQTLRNQEDSPLTKIIYTSGRGTHSCLSHFRIK
jgi:hypothetical protein